MKGSHVAEQVIGIPVVSGTLLLTDSKTTRYQPGCDYQSHGLRKVPVLRRMNKLGKKADHFARSVREHGN